MRTSHALTAGLLFTGLGLLSAGCGQRTLPVAKTHPASGKITIKGEPAAFVLVTLRPTDSKGVQATGKTNQEGAFELRTYSNTGEPDGAVPGDYTVILEGHNPVKMGGLPEGAKPTEIKGEMDTGITIQITDGDNSLSIAVP
jgi:hypothetical protein